MIIPVNNTYIDFFGIHLEEPTTAITNVMITALSLFLYFRLGHPTKEFKVNSYWKIFFLFFSMAAFFGIFKHGFKSYFDPSSFSILQLLGHLTSVPIAYANLKINVEVLSLSDEKKKKYNLAIVIFSIAITLLTIIYNQFIVVKIMAAIAILATIIIHIILYRKGDSAAGKILKGFLVSITSVVVHSTKFSFCEWFNYNDIAHVFMMISLLYLYQGVKMMTGQTETSKSTS